MRLPAHKTKIVCTIGPASRSEAVLEQLILRGMNVARLNFAHGTLQEHRESIRPTRAEDVFSLNTVECGKVKADPV